MGPPPRTGPFRRRVHAVVVALQTVSRSLTDKYARLRPDNPAGPSQGLISRKTSAQIPPEQSVSPCLRQATECFCRHSPPPPPPHYPQQKRRSCFLWKMLFLWGFCYTQHKTNILYLRRHEHSNMFLENTRRRGGTEWMQETDTINSSCPLKRQKNGRRRNRTTFINILH